MGLLRKTALAAGVTLTLVAGAGVAHASDTKQLSYAGHEFTVPASWPVYDLTAQPDTCVRFDRHAVYLGTPGDAQHCPTRIVGKTEALLVSPATGTAPNSDDAIAHEIDVTAGSIQVTATYRDQPQQMRQILTGAGLSTTDSRVVVPALVTAAGTDYTGKGFDACTAPSSGEMSAWLSSPYRAVGVYIGGSERGCAQPNLTADWVAQQAAAGWHFLPLYVGPQANNGGITSPVSQGASAAQDAVTQAQHLGFAQGSVLYYDMEAYSPSQSGAALSFLSAWTQRLHAQGYKSGVYSSSSSGISDLAGHIGSYTMPDVIDDALWNGAANTADPAIPSGDWTPHQRVHQYSGDVTESYGGVSIPIDQDYLDVAVGTAPAGQDGSTLVAPNGEVVSFSIDGQGNLYQDSQSGQGGAFGGWSKLYSGGNLMGAPASLLTPGKTVLIFSLTKTGGVEEVGQSTELGPIDITTNLGGAGLAGGPAAVVTPDGTVTLVAVHGDGNLWEDTESTPGGAFSGWVRIYSAGDLRGAPAAVVAPNGTVATFSRTATGGIELVGQATKGGAYSSATNLGGAGLAGGPSAVLAPNGTVALFATHADGDLWLDDQTAAGGSFAGWAKIAASGDLTRTPASIVAPNGTIATFTHTISGDVQLVGQSAAGGAFSASHDLGHGGSPFVADPLVTLAPNGTVVLFARGADNNHYESNQATQGGTFTAWLKL
jgi:hypothetical protein